MSDARQLPSTTVLTAAAAVVGSAVTLFVIVVPNVSFAHRSIRGHVALETFDACVAGAVALLFFGRQRRTSSWSDLLLSNAFLLLALTSLFVVALPSCGVAGGAAATVWFPLATRLLAATGIALAAAASNKHAPSGLERARVATSLVVSFAAGAVLVTLVPFHARPPLDAAVSPARSTHVLFTGNTLVVVMQLLHALLYAVAAIQFTRAAGRNGDLVRRWIGPGCALASAARVNYALFPSLYSQWLYVGDLLRTLFYLVLLVAAVAEVREYWAAQTDTAVHSERRRLARDLHDGTVQELGYIRTLAQQLRARDPQSADRIIAASDRALAEARSAISALSMPLGGSALSLVAAAAREVADRYDVTVQVSGDASYVGSDELRAALVRITREAVSNGARHGGSQVVRVTVERGSLEVVDDGTGFDVGVSGDGFGMVSMRDRAEAIGGHLQVTSTPTGTTIKVEWDAQEG